MNRLIDIQEIWDYFELMYKNPKISAKKLKKIAHLELDNTILVRIWGNEQTDRHTRNRKTFGS